ncbi:unnamed protein product [Closterium sp. Naga37s-1]|nr:unnamed protein product [Closterium sp. Naga37s-1]
MANRNHRRAQVGNSLFTVYILCVGLLVSPDHTSASRDIAAPQQFARSRETLGASTPEIVTAIENHENSGGQSFDSAVRESAAADAEAAKALAEYEDAKKVLEGKKVDAEGISSEASKLRGQAEEVAFGHAVIATEVAESAERERKSTADLKRAEEVAEKAAAFAAGKRKVADEASAAAEKAARLAEAEGTAEAQLALVRAKTTRAEAVRVAEVAETTAVEAKESAEEVWEAFSREESDMDVSVVDLVSEEAYIEDLKAATADLEEEYRKSVAAVEVAKAKVEELKGLAEEKVARKRKVADEASAALGEAARLAEAAHTAGAQLALERARFERAEAVRAAEEAETVAEEATENAEDAWEAYSQEESDVEISVVDIEAEETYIEDLKTAAARFEEEYRKSVTAVEVAKAKVEELKGLAEGKVARAKAMRAALRKGGKSNGRDVTTATK